MQKQAMASSKLLLLSLALLLVTLSFIANFTSASLEEANALQKWKASLQIPNNSQIVSSWTPLPTNTRAPALCPSWFGITCNADGNINRLSLSTSELKVPTINQEDATQGSEPTETMMKFRSAKALEVNTSTTQYKGAVYLGQMLVWENADNESDKVINVGDDVHVEKVFSSYADVAV